MIGVYRGAGLRSEGTGRNAWIATWRSLSIEQQKAEPARLSFQGIPTRKQSQTEGSRCCLLLSLLYQCVSRDYAQLGPDEGGPVPTHDDRAVMNGAPRFLSGSSAENRRDGNHIRCLSQAASLDAELPGEHYAGGRCASCVRAIDNQRTVKGDASGVGGFRWRCLRRRECSISGCSPSPCGRRRSATLACGSSASYA